MCLPPCADPISDEEFPVSGEAWSCFKTAGTRPAPASRERRKPTRGPERWARQERSGNLPRPPSCLPTGCLCSAAGCEPRARSRGDSGHPASTRTENRPGTNPNTGRSSPSPRRISPGFAAWPGPRPHSPTSAREARLPPLGGAHPKPPLQRSLAL